MPYLMALDQGTSSTRTLIFDTKGTVVAMAQQGLPQHYPQPGWVEHDARQIWEHQLATMQQALKSSGLNASDLAAIGITNQRETVVLWDRATGQALGPALVWQDKRTEAICMALKAAGHEAMVRSKTGLLLDPYFSATKMAWLLDHIPGARARAIRGELAMGTIDTWLVWNLTRNEGREALHRTDPSNASRTLLFNIHTGAWDPQLLALFDVPLQVLPEVVPSSGVMGKCNANLLGAPVPIAGLAGDQQAALFGQSCIRPGQAKNTYGTGCFMLMHTGTEAKLSQAGLLTTAAAQIDNKPAYALEGSVFMAGAVVQWLRDSLHLFTNSQDIEALALSVPDSGGVMFVPAFTGLGAPYWRADARAAILGMTRGTTGAHIARAALESIALQTTALAAAMNADGTTQRQAQLKEMRVDGGACSNNFLMQLQADLLGVPVMRPKMTEVTALGAACLAGLAVGVLADVDEVRSMWQLDRRFEPQQNKSWSDALMQQWAHAIRQVTAP
jgi:glycerol kinase